MSQKYDYDAAYIYMNEDYYKNPKEIFKFIGTHIEKYFNNTETELNLLDVGCARGEFLYYINNKFTNLKDCYGIDLLEELIKSAQSFKGLNSVNFSASSADDYKIDKKFNIITMIGLLAALPNINNVFLNAGKHQDKDDILFVFCRFNENDADVRVHYKNVKQNKDWQSTGAYSLKSIDEKLQEAGYEKIDLVKFNLPFDIEENKDDPIRSFTLNTEDGQKFVNGLGMIFDFKLLIARKVK